jgi:hypothetical protein
MHLAKVIGERFRLLSVCVVDSLFVRFCIGVLVFVKFVITPKFKRYQRH